MSEALLKIGSAAPIRASDAYYNSKTIYNEKIDPIYVDVPETDESTMGRLVRGMASILGGCFSPKNLIAIFRFLKAWTFCCPFCTVVTELIYIFSVELQVSKDVLNKLGGGRDELLRVYGILLATFAIFIELDMTVIDNNCPSMKFFIPRSCLLFFITTLSGTSPIIGYETYIINNLRSIIGTTNQKYAYNAYDDDSHADMEYIRNEVAGMPVAFQAVSAFFLFISACLYLLLGLLCFDRYTSDAFIKDDRPVFVPPAKTDSDDRVNRKANLDICNYDGSMPDDGMSIDITGSTTTSSPFKSARSIQPVDTAATFISM